MPDEIPVSRTELLRALLVERYGPLHEAIPERPDTPQMKAWRRRLLNRDMDTGDEPPAQAAA